MDYYHINIPTGFLNSSEEQKNGSSDRQFNKKSPLGGNTV